MNEVERINEHKAPDIAVFFLAIGMYAKEFYFSKSGTLQIGDACFVIAFILMTLCGRMIFQKIDLWLIAFIACSVLVNLTYAAVYGDNSFIVYASYLIYSILIVGLTRSFYKDAAALRTVSIALKAAICTQILISLLGMGRYYFNRYIGTFNDPNQLGYYVLTSLFLIVIIDFSLGRKTSVLWILGAFYLIALSQSSGMLLGFVVFVLFAIWNSSFVKDCSPRKEKLVKTALVFGGVLISMLLLAIDGDVELVESIHVSGFQRLVNKLTDVSSIKDVLWSYVKDRSITRVLTDPAPLLYGAGEGRWIRYPEGNEIHSTIISLCYYYGVVPYSMWIGWVRGNLKNMSPKVMCVYIALIVEALTLANHRQPFFWMLIVLAFKQECKAGRTH